MRQLKFFLADDAGATAIEYALISALIAIALVTILGSLGSAAQRRVLGSQQRA